MKKNIIIILVVFSFIVFGVFMLYSNIIKFDNLQLPDKGFQYPQVLIAKDNIKQIIHLNKGQVVFKIEKLKSINFNAYICNNKDEFLFDLNNSANRYIICWDVPETDAYLLHTTASGFWNISYR
jgi:hypothetical protein